MKRTRTLADCYNNKILFFLIIAVLKVCPVYAEGANTIMGFISPNVRIYELTVGGRLDFNKEWSDEGSKNVSQAVKTILREHNIKVESPRITKETSDELEDVIALYGAITDSVLAYSIPYSKKPLPGKFGYKGYQLGPLLDLFDKLGIDELLVVYASDEISSTGRRLMMFDYGLSAGTTRVSAGIIGKDGFIKWFEVESYAGKYDLRESSSAQKILSKVFSNYKAGK